MKNNTLRKKLGLYAEGLRQSKVIGIPFVCFSVLMLLYEVLAELSRVYVLKGPETGFAAVLIVSFLATPLMLLILFNFLNSRKASDFYHSIPRSRGSLYLSFGAAAVSWSVVIITVMTLFEMLVYAVFGYQLDIATYGQVLLAAICSNVLITGSVLLAISISSTVFSQVVISGLILFLPRVLIACFEDVVTNIVPILPSFEQALGIIGSPRANIIIGLVAYDLSGDALWQSCLYSLAVGIAYAALGMLFFCRRKSETAASPALNRWVQTGVRVVIAFAICLLPTIELAKEINKGTPVSSIGFDIILVFYGIALIAYFVYEALSNRSIRGIWKSWRELLVGLAVLVVLNLAFIFGAGLSADAVLRFQPENDEVVSISIQDDNRYYSYSDLRIAETEITDEAIKDFLASQMRKNVENINIINQSYRYDGYYGETYAYYSYELLVKFTMQDGSEVTRYVYMSEPEDESLTQNLLHNEDYIKAALDYPTDYQTITLFGSSAAADELTDEQIRELYSIYVSEIADADPVKYITRDLCSIAEIYVDGRYNGKEYSSEFPIYLGTPRTLNAYIEMTRSDESLTDVLKMADKASYYNIGISGYNFYNSGNYYEQFGNSYEFYNDYEDEYTMATSYYDEAASEIYVYGYLYSEENMEAVLAELKANQDVPLDITKPFYVVNIDMEYEVTGEADADYDSYTSYGTYTYKCYEFFIQAAEEGSCLEDPEFVMDNVRYRNN